MLIILDDDPTGTQTVQGIPILTNWSVPNLRAELSSTSPAFFILTNTRAMPAAAAETINREIARNLKSAAAGKPFTLVTRSDSTLRGHFPLETDILSQELGPFDATLLIPYFEAGGRLTIDDIHYVRENGQLTPAADTPFAKDAAFGFRSSNLRDYIEEKTNGRIKRDQVISIPAGVPADNITNILLDLQNNTHAIVNAATPEDLTTFRDALALAESSGKRFLFRTAAEFVRAWLRQEPSPLLDHASLVTTAGPGLIIAGSYVPKTTAQLEHLRASTGIDTIELSVPALLSAGHDEEIQRARQAIHHHLTTGRDTLVMTSRHLVTSAAPAESLRLGQIVSDALIALVSSLTTRPAWIIAKGGITSSDIATQGLGVKRAVVLGQILPGVPVWQTGPETRFPGISYIVFPGNVGGPESLTQAVNRCQGV